MTEKRLQLAVIGAGEHASNVIHPALLFNDRIDVVGCCDRDADRANLAAKRLGAPAFTEVNDMLTTVKADAAFVVAFPWVQADLTISCLEAGLHVFTEKPLATDMNQAERVKDAPVRAERQVAVGFMMRFNPVFQKMREAIQSAEFGEPSLFHSRFVAGYRPKTSIIHLHCNLRLGIDPKILEIKAREAFAAQGWTIDKIVPNVFQVQGAYRGKLVFLGRHPELVYDLGWRFDPSVICEPSFEPWSREDVQPGFDLCFTSEFNALIEKDPYVRLQDGEIEEIVTGF